MRRRVERLETRRRAGDEPDTSQIEALSDDRLLVLSRLDAAGRAEALRTGRPLRVREMTDDELAMLADTHEDAAGPTGDDERSTTP